MVKHEQWYLSDSSWICRSLRFLCSHWKMEKGIEDKTFVRRLRPLKEAIGSLESFTSFFRKRKRAKMWPERMVKVNYRLDNFLWFDCFIGFLPRVGIIIEYPLNGLFHDLVNIIIMSQVAISEMLDNTNRSYSNMRQCILLLLRTAPNTKPTKRSFLA